jgi:hypothetical protein
MFLVQRACFSFVLGNRLELQNVVQVDFFWRPRVRTAVFSFFLLKGCAFFYKAYGDQAIETLRANRAETSRFYGGRYHSLSCEPNVRTRHPDVGNYVARIYTWERRPTELTRRRFCTPYKTLSGVKRHRASDPHQNSESHRSKSFSISMFLRRVSGHATSLWVSATTGSVRS